MKLLSRAAVLVSWLGALAWERRYRLGPVGLKQPIPQAAVPGTARRAPPGGEARICRRP